MCIIVLRRKWKDRLLPHLLTCNLLGPMKTLEINLSIYGMSFGITYNTSELAYNPTTVDGTQSDPERRSFSPLIHPTEKFLRNEEAELGPCCHLQIQTDFGQHKCLHFSVCLSFLVLRTIVF